jgi:hypothetical protein
VKVQASRQSGGEMHRAAISQKIRGFYEDSRKKPVGDADDIS